MNRSMLAWTLSMLMLATPALAQRGGGAAKPHSTPAPKPVAAQGATKPHGGAPKPATSQGGGKVHASAPKSGTAQKSGATTKTTTKTAASARDAKTSKAAKTTNASSTSAPSTTTLSPVQQKLQRNTNLAAKLQSRLPAGTDLQLAAAGFRNLGQFVAAVNVSNNLGIPFAELKTRMVDQGMSLGQAIQDARPATTDTTTVVRRAETDADDLIRATDSTTTAKTKTSKKPSSGGRK